MRRLLIWLTAATVWAAGVYGAWVVMRAGNHWPAPVPADRQIVTVVPDTNLVATLRRTDEQPEFVGPIELWNLETGERTATHPLPDNWEDLYAAGSGNGLLSGNTKWANPDAPLRPEDQILDAATGRVIIRTRLCASRCGGQVFAAEWFDDAGETVTLYDATTGRVGVTVRDCLTFLTRDGRFVVTSRPEPNELGTKYTVWETASGREVGVIRHAPSPGIFRSSNSVTNTGQQFVDTDGGVWDVATGKRVWQHKDCGAGISSEDGTWVIAESVSGGQRYVAWFDAATGREAVERRIPAPDPLPGFMMSVPLTLFPAGSTGRLAVCRGRDQSTPSAVSRLLTRLTGVPAATSQYRSIVFDTQTGAVVAETSSGYVLPGFDSGRLLLVGDDNEQLTVWRLPPADWRTRALAVAAGWGLVVVLVGRWAARGERPASAG